MKEILDKLISIEKEVTKERGALDLLALFLRENSPNKWDILVSAGWVSKDYIGSRKYLSHKIQSQFTGSELVKTSRLVIIDSDNPGLAEVLAINTDNDIVEVRNREFFDLDIRHAYLITTARKAAA